MLAAEARVELGETLVAIGAGGQRDRPIRMQMIDVIEWQKRVQRRVDRRGDAVVTKRAERIARHHLVFVRLAAIAANQRLELVEIEQRKPDRHGSIAGRRRFP